MKTLKLTLALLLTACYCCAQSSQSTSSKAQKVKEQVAVMRAKQEALQKKKEKARLDSLAHANALKDSLLKDSLKRARATSKDIKVNPTGKHFENSPLGQTDAGHDLVDLHNKKGGAPLPPTRPKKPKLAAPPCPHCSKPMVRRDGKYEIECKECKGKGWYGLGKNKEEARKNRTLQDPCNYCGGKKTKTLEGKHWECLRCKQAF